MTAVLLVDTDQYSLAVTGTTTARRRVSNRDEAGDWQDLGDLLLQDVFISDCLVDGDHGPLLVHERMLARFKSGEAVIRFDRLGTPPVYPSTAFAFPDRRLSLDDIERLTVPSLLPEAVKTGFARRYDFWDDNHRGKMECGARSRCENGNGRDRKTSVCLMCSGVSRKRGQGLKPKARYKVSALSMKSAV